MPSLSELLRAAPKLNVQIQLAILHTILWYFLINHVFVPITISVINNLKTKKRFIYFNRQTFKKMLGWDLGDNEEEQILAISRIDAAFLQHLVSGILAMPSAFGIGSSLLPIGVASAMARHACLCEYGWETEDFILRIYELIFCGEKGRKLNSMNLMLILIAHHSAAWCMVIPMNIFYPYHIYFHEVVCIVSLGAFVVSFLQQYGHTLNVETQEGLTKMKISVTISFFTVLWTRVLRYAWLSKMIYDTLLEDENWFILRCFAAPAILMNCINASIFKDGSEKFRKFVTMKIKKAPIGKIKDVKELATKSARIFTKNESSKKRKKRLRKKKFKG